MLYLMDVQGTLVGNVGGLSEDECLELIAGLRRLGDVVLVWSSSGASRPLSPSADGVSERMSNELGPVALKDPVSWRHVIYDTQCCIVDDEDMLLRVCKRMGAQTMHAKELRGLLQKVRHEVEALCVSAR